MERRCINLIKQELRRKTLPSCPAVGKGPQRPALSRPRSSLSRSNPSSHNIWYKIPRLRRLRDCPPPPPRSPHRARPLPWRRRTSSRHRRQPNSTAGPPASPVLTLVPTVRRSTGGPPWSQHRRRPPHGRHRRPRPRPWRRPSRSSMGCPTTGLRRPRSQQR